MNQCFWSRVLSYDVSSEKSSFMILSQDKSASTKHKISYKCLPQKSLHLLSTTTYVYESFGEECPSKHLPPTKAIEKYFRFCCFPFKDPMVIKTRGIPDKKDFLKVLRNLNIFYTFASSLPGFFFFCFC